MSEVARVLRTPRLTLTATTADLAEGIWKAVEVSMAELMPWLAWAEGDDLAHTRAFVDECERAWEAGTSWIFTIVHDGAVAGTIGLGGHVPLIERAELGYWMRSDIAGRGLMTEAASAVVSFGFDEVGLHRIELHAAPGNVGSIRVAERLGFQREGMLRDGSRGSGGWHDVYCYGLVATDPRPRFHLLAQRDS